MGILETRSTSEVGYMNGTWGSLYHYNQRIFWETYGLHGETH